MIFKNWLKKFDKLDFSTWNIFKKAKDLFGYIFIFYLKK